MNQVTLIRVQVLTSLESHKVRTFFAEAKRNLCKLFQNIHKPILVFLMEEFYLIQIIFSLRFKYSSQYERRGNYILENKLMITDQTKIGIA